MQGGVRNLGAVSKLGRGRPNCVGNNEIILNHM